MWKILFESVRGASHHRTGQPCQDYCQAIEVPLKSETAIILACADGAGSSDQSDVGARLACDRIISLISSELCDREHLTAIAAEDVSRWIDTVHAELQYESALRDTEPRQLACTLLVAVVGDSGAGFFQIGDGAIVVLDDGIYHNIFWPQSGEYANTTFFITDPHYADHLKFEWRDARIDEISMFTDGLQMLTLDYARHQAHGPFFAPLFESLRRTPIANTLIAPMQAFLNSHEITERTDDDKTLMLATRVEANEATN